jgi:hypothetical protein
MVAAVLIFLLLFQGPPGAGGAVASGQVRLGNGSPVAAIRVSAIPAPPPNIKPSDGQNYYAVQTPARIALTDDQGRYRLANLPAGRYFIVAGMIGQATFYPATTDIETATVLTIAAGSTTEALDVTLRTTPGGRVTGRVNPPTGDGPPERAVLSGLRLGELLEVPVRPDGTFDFGRLVRGEYLVSLYPTPPGLRSLPFRLGDDDVSSLRFERPVLRTVSGRVVSEKGPIPATIVGFETPESLVNAPINPDGTFSARLQAAHHRVELGGLPVGYSISTVRVGSQNAADGFTVGNRDISDVVVTLATPRQLPSLTGRITGVEQVNVPSLQVELTGAIIGSVRAPLQKDGSFEVPNLPSGLYRVRIPQIPEFVPVNVVVTSSGGQLSAALPTR